MISILFTVFEESISFTKGAIFTADQVDSLPSNEMDFPVIF